MHAPMRTLFVCISLQGFTYVAPGLLAAAESEAELLEKSAAGGRGRKGCSESGEEQLQGSQESAGKA